VTLVDWWGPGNSRSSSGDETRVIRGAYGPNVVYTRMVAESVEAWRALGVLEPVGSLWLAPDSGDAWERASMAAISSCGLECVALPGRALAERWPWVNWSGIGWGVFEPGLGYLHARRACQAVARRFVAEGGAYLQTDQPPEADATVLACGPWLSEFVVPTRQEVFYFGTPPGEWNLPAWVDNTPPRHYGIPGNDGRGFKVAMDVAGPEFDPTAGDRTPSPAALRHARDYLAFRFPAFRDAPMVESRVCQYEMSADGHLVLGRHPRLKNTWVAGGGSGHGFKLGPAVGSRMAALVLGEAEEQPEFSPARLAGMARRWERR
jgi:glycine/D-amino acid oxidase-like deaminating enzyme